MAFQSLEFAACRGSPAAATMLGGSAGRRPARRGEVCRSREKLQVGYSGCEQQRGWGRSTAAQTHSCPMPLTEQFA